MKKYLAAGAVLVVALLSGCGGGSSPAADPSSPPGNAPVVTAAGADKLDDGAKAQAGCKDAVKKDTGEMFVHSLFDCRGQNLYVFANSDARDNWMKIASGFGAIEVRRGATWLLTKT